MSDDICMYELIDELKAAIKALKAENAQMLKELTRAEAQRDIALVAADMSMDERDEALQELECAYGMRGAC